MLPVGNLIKNHPFKALYDKIYTVGYYSGFYSSVKDKIWLNGAATCIQQTGKFCRQGETIGKDWRFEFDLRIWVFLILIFCLVKTYSNFLGAGTASLSYVVCVLL